MAGLPVQWRLEALEAVIDVLAPELDEAEVDRLFAELVADGEGEPPEP